MTSFVLLDIESSWTKALSELWSMPSISAGTAVHKVILQQAAPSLVIMLHSRRTRKPFMTTGGARRVTLVATAVARRVETRARTSRLLIINAKYGQIKGLRW
jgi:hypothetical protein